MMWYCRTRYLRICRRVWSPRFSIATMSAGLVMTSQRTECLVPTQRIVEKKNMGNSWLWLECSRYKGIISVSPRRLAASPGTSWRLLAALANPLVFSSDDRQDLGPQCYIQHQSIFLRLKRHRYTLRDIVSNKEKGGGMAESTSENLRQRQFSVLSSWLCVVGPNKYPYDYARGA